MQVKDVMTRDPVVVAADAPVREAAGLLRKHRIGGLPVLDVGRLVGIITEGDILRLLQTPGISGDLWLPSPLEVIEVQSGDYLGEDDIVRFDDEYGRE